MSKKLVVLLIVFSAMLSIITYEGNCQNKLIDISEKWGDSGNYPLSKLGSSVRYIKLETTPSVMIGPAYKFQYKIIRDTIYITSEGSPMYVFNPSGKYVRQIGTVGRGPREFIKISSYAIDYNKGQVWISDRQQGKILIYSLSGEFISEFRNTAGSYKLFSNSMGGVSMFYRSYLIEENINKVYSFGNNSAYIDSIQLYTVQDLKEHRRSVALSTISLIKSRLHIIEKPSLQEYILQDRSWIPSWKFISNGGEIIKIRQSETHFFIHSANPYAAQFIAEKGSGEAFKCSFAVDASGPDAVGAYNDLDGGLPFWPKHITDEGDLVCMYESYDLVSYAMGQSSSYGGKPPKMTEAFKEFVGQLAVDDNPVIAIVSTVDKN